MSKLLAIVGPTASGKSELALWAAKQFNGEIICADSRTIYRGMDIGTAKPTKAEQAEVSHHLLDLTEPNQAFSAAEFKQQALNYISKIESRGHLPILVGGSGLYLYSVLYDYQFPAGPANQLRSDLQQLSEDALAERLRQADPEAAESIDLKNPRRIIRAIETAGQPKQQTSLKPGSILIGLKPSEEKLQKRIKIRTDQMLQAGLIDEVTALVKQFGIDIEAWRSPGYAEVVRFLGGHIKESDLADLISTHTRQLAKRQLTWFKRNADINWFETVDEAEKFISQQLSGKV